MKIAALFPGQGSQVVGMAKVLRDQFPWTKAVYEEASDAVKLDLLKLCLDGPADDLQLTENTQPAILVTSVAWFQVMRRTFDFQPAAGAGHSLGEYSALVAAEALTLGNAAALVQMRGRLMQSAVPPEKGKMAAVLGLADYKVEALCKAASKGDDSLVVPANYNAPSQVVIAGHSAAVDRAQALAANVEYPEWKARKVIPLKVSAPFHCPLMKPVAEAFVPYLDSVRWQPLRFPVVSNLDGELQRESNWVPRLRDQIDHPVRWTACVKSLETFGCDAYVEMGPGKVLVGLVKRIAEDGKLFSMESVEDLQAFEKYLKENT